MDTPAKITLSAKELELVCNTDWILTKHAIIAKVYDLFGQLLPNMEAVTAANQARLPERAYISSAKISKGENYQLLPYVILDYPRHFANGTMLAIRTMFWWGNFFSVSLLISGIDKTRAIPVLQNSFTTLQQRGYWICIHANPWQHHFEADNMIPLQTCTWAQFTTILDNKSFVKISKKMPIEHWDNAVELIGETFKEMILLLQTN